MRLFALVLPLVALSGCVASVDMTARTRAARDLSCPASQLVVEHLDNLGPETVEVSGCDATARYTCPVSAGAGPALNQRICIRETASLRRMETGSEEIRLPAK